MMAATLLSLKGHFCPSFTPNEKKSLFGRKNRMIQPDSLNVGMIALGLRSARGDWGSVDGGRRRTA